jgi:predicted transposase/invertase (TIGR01784 family)
MHRMTSRQVLKQEGNQEGFTVGLLIGVKTGREEGKIEVAKALLLNLHLDIDSVQMATGLQKTDLEQILQGSR